MNRRIAELQAWHHPFFTLINEDNRIENKRQLDRLRMRLAHTLMLFKRKAVVELILLRRASLNPANGKIWPK